jgi:thioredoxin reductase (NADPH)
MYDLIIIGAGPAGMNAALYAARYKMKVALIGKLPGGYVNEAHLVENWLGDKSIPGLQLAERFKDHIKSLEIDFIESGVRGITKGDDGYEVVAESQKDSLKSPRLILALGTERKKLNIKGEEEFLGKGVSYCVTCDGFFFRDRVVAVVGGSDSACTGSIMLADIAKKVYLIYRQGELRAEPAWVEEVKKNPKIEVVYNANPVEVKGENIVKSVALDNGTELEIDGLFIEIGTTPGAALINGLGVETDEKGYIKVDENMKTNLDKVWAAGDITTANSKLKQIVVAASEGAVATYNAFLDKKSSN